MALTPSADSRAAEMDDGPGLGRLPGFMIRRAQQAHVAVWQRVASDTVTSVQFGVLRVLDRMPGASQRELGAELDLDRSTITELVTRLQRQGLLHRERHPFDRRRNVLRLTAAGTRELVTMEDRVEQVNRLLVAGLSPDEQAQLRRLLARVVASAAIDAARTTVQ